ncbi:hypothetical protein IQ260_24750 [Leptolyngbya cf. ectocarpi LEGE 11479]|uniref:Tetratricopeptide repeat protein n=1 Tax=Leptolyngbya cf. ectocarpi LEGE 11479 TaxID=1828722 RepID=A0A928ZYI7_LEPEC|nr:hypothetical protein [Leptolyngbya ectocarpi]MBE9069857.1 hypothetical protein [Leptolyngbya cf. ectocarpi LEGE 11479]
MTININMRSIKTTKNILLCVVAFLMASCSQVHTKVSNDSERLLALEMLELENQYKEVPPQSSKLLNAILNEGVAVLGKKATEPETAEEAIAAAIMVSRVLAQNNFFQPIKYEDTPYTLGQALAPKNLLDEEIDAILAFEANNIRKQYYDSTKPIYLVDCDMASLIMFSIFERLGWDTRLVKAPMHMFLRWHLPNGSTVNWDWSNWNSFEDEDYFLAYGATAEEQRKQGTYLQSLSKNETRGNFIGLIGSSLDNKEKSRALMEKSIKLAPNNPTNLNNLAWLYATDPDFSIEYSEVAIMLAHRSVAADISYMNRLGTLACAYAADGNWNLAIGIKKGLIERHRSTIHFENYQKNLKRIEQKKLCEY